MTERELTRYENWTNSVISRIPIFGQDVNVELMTIAVLAGENVFAMGDSGQGKTATVKAATQLSGLKYGYINCGGDLDKIAFTGHYRYDKQTGDELWTPSLAENVQILFCDEVTRLADESKNALLEGMADGIFTDERGVEHQFDSMLSYVFAGNPVKSEGTNGAHRAFNDRCALSLYFYDCDGESAAAAGKAKRNAKMAEVDRRREGVEPKRNPRLRPQLNPDIVGEIRAGIDECQANARDELFDFSGRIYEHFGGQEWRVEASNRFVESVWRMSAARSVCRTGRNSASLDDVLTVTMPCLYAVVEPKRYSSELDKRRQIAEALVNFLRQDRYYQANAAKSGMPRQFKDENGGYDLEAFLPEVTEGRLVKKTQPAHLKRVA